MAAQGYTHKILTIKCCIDSSSTTKNIKWSQSEDWDKNMSMLVSKIEKKFGVGDKKWTMLINGAVVDQQDSKTLQRVLSSTPPVAVVEIVVPTKHTAGGGAVCVILHFGDKQFEYQVEQALDEWTSEMYQTFLSSIAKAFGIATDQFCLFVDVGGHRVYVDDEDDLMSVFEDDDSQLLHLFVESLSAIKDMFAKRIKVVFGGKSFTWSPSRTHGAEEVKDDVEQWQKEYASLFQRIESEFSLRADSVQLHQSHNGSACDINDGDGLMEVWQGGDEGTDSNDAEFIAEIEVVAVTDQRAVMAMDDGDDEKEVVSIIEASLTEKLSNLGSKIGALRAEEKNSCFKEIKRMKENAKVPNAAHRFEQMLRPICQKESLAYQECIVCFLRLLGFGVQRSNIEEKEEDPCKYHVTGKQADEDALQKITAKFHHLANAVQSPKIDIYQQLQIEIPRTPQVKRHASGIYDDQFVIFELPQIVMEKQQSSLVDKTVLNPRNLERFINFLRPSSSKYQCKDIYFEKLESLKLAPIGFFGSRREILDMLFGLKAISRPLVDVLLRDDECQFLSSGIHAILPVGLQTQKEKSSWDGTVFLFYWSLPQSFDMDKMKAVKYMRRDPSCLLSRVLYELSSTVCVRVSSQELNDFGVFKRDAEDLAQLQAQPQSRPRRSRGKVLFNVEETKENHVMCEQRGTLSEKLHLSDASEVFLLNGSTVSMYCCKYEQQERLKYYQKVKSFSNEDKMVAQTELVTFLQDLSNRCRLVAGDQLCDDGRFMLCKAVIPVLHAAYEEERATLQQQEKQASKQDKLNGEAKQRVKLRKLQIKQEFFNLYINAARKQHQRIKDIAQQLKESGVQLPEYQTNNIGMSFQQLQCREMSHSLTHWQQSSMICKEKEFVNETNKILSDYDKKIKKYINKGAEIVSEIQSSEKPKPGKIDKTLAWMRIKAIEKPISDDEWKQLKRQNIDKAEKKTKELINGANVTVIRVWGETFAEQFKSYKETVYGFEAGSIIHFPTVRNEIEKEIEAKYARQYANLKVGLFDAFAESQKQKENLQTVTLKQYVASQSSRYPKNEVTSTFQISYVEPKAIPPSHELRFTYIDLPSIEETMKLQMKMAYEILQTDDLLFHYMLRNNEVIMAIRSDNEEQKTSTTRIVVSTHGALCEDVVAKTIKKDRVLNVAFCESQNIFAIFFEDRLAFAMLQDDGRIVFTNSGCDLLEMQWFNTETEFSAILMQENDKNVFVWCVDQENYVRAFAVDTNDWDTAKEFQLDQKYDAFTLSPDGAFLIAFKPQYEEDVLITAGSRALADNADVEVNNPSDEKENTPEAVVNNPSDDSSDGEKRNFAPVPDITADGTTEKEAAEPGAVPEQQELGAAVEEKQSVATKPAPDPKPAAKTPTGKLQLHAFLLRGKRKLRYKIHASSLTGYETDSDPKQTDKNKHELDEADNVLLPDAFSLGAVNMQRLSIKKTNKANMHLLCGINNQGELLYHPLLIQVAFQRLRIHKQKKKITERRITKLDYMEYMMEKFGSRAAVFYPKDGKLSLHTTYIVDDGDECKNIDDLCAQIAQTICTSLYDKEKKDFKFLSWQHKVLRMAQWKSVSAILNDVGNQSPLLSGDEFIRNLIVQIPIQIARGVHNTFQLMYNGEDDQSEYHNSGAIGSRSLCKLIRFGAYDGLIKSWEGDIKIVTSMGKQNTGKSYMLNHLFGTKFDISGGRCTDGAWLTVRVLNDTLFILCDFEGLGSFERSPQEDMLLATFNSSISNCTLFKCENHFDRSMEELFNNFQTGVKIMRGSKNCFAGELLLVIKDIVDAGAEEAEEEFQTHIERLAQESSLFENEQGEQESTFFAVQMYGNGLTFEPYPPLDSEKFFVKLNTVIEPAIDEIKALHVGGKQFLDHIKLIMSKLNIGDWAAMSDEHAKIRIEELRSNLKNAVIAGAIIQPKNAEFGVTFEVEDDANLLLLDGNKLIACAAKETISHDQVKDFDETMETFEEFDADIKAKLLQIAEGLRDAGLMLGKPETLSFLYEQFSVQIKRTHSNFRQWSAAFQCFLDIIYWRRFNRVRKYIRDNTQRFGDLAKNDADSLWQQAEIRLNGIRDKMRICKSVCKECYYLCLLCKNHEDYPKWANDHVCHQVKHSCTELCVYCKQEGVEACCGDKSGHSGNHNCRSRTKPHTCGKQCSLYGYGGCQEKCCQESGHDELTLPCKCKCNAETHYCVEKCSVPICNNSCKVPYNAPEHQHICIQTSCPYKCQVRCWSETLQTITECGRDCSYNDHAHHLQEEGKTNRDELHICNQQHPCPEECNDAGLCSESVEIKRRIVKREVLTTGAGSTIEYDAFTEVNAVKKRCCKKIPVGKFKHDGNDHRCYSGDPKDNIHTCDEQCDACGYYCREKYNHYKECGSEHDCVHGNMRNTVFYATEEIVDTGDARKYRVGDSGVAEMCNVFCERLGRGHIHLELCQSELQKKECYKEEGRRHQQKEYKPDPHLAKDEVTHSKFWRRKKWKDPCIEQRRPIFNKCNFACNHPSHKEQESKSGEDDATKYCVENLWHTDCKTPTGHRFKCSHPFCNAHVVFVCDISGSMSLSDDGKFKPEYSWINKCGKLNNRLGALYSCIYKFIRLRTFKDTVTAVMTPPRPRAFAAERVVADLNFVQNYLLPFKPTGCQNYGQAFRDAQSKIKESEDTVVIFLCDGESCDDGASAIAASLRSAMGNKFALFCITIGPKASGNNPTVEAICSAGGGKMGLISALSGNELLATFQQIAVQMNTGTFGALNGKK